MHTSTTRGASVGSGRAVAHVSDSIADATAAVRAIVSLSFRELLEMILDRRK
jgi:hypothetical protein